MFWLCAAWFIAGMFFGLFVMFVVLALCQAASRGDEYEEWRRFSPDGEMIEKNESEEE